MVVNNAGIGMRTVNPRFFDDPRPFFEVSPEGFMAVVATNLTGYFLVARAFAAVFVEQRQGRFMNISMNHEHHAPAGLRPLRAVACWRRIPEPHHDRGPAAVRHRGEHPASGWRHRYRDDPRRAGRRARRSLLPPEIMGPPVVFLASAEAEGITGERIVAKDFDAWLADFRSRARTGT